MLHHPLDKFDRDRKFMHRQKGTKTSVDHPFLLLVGKLWYKRTNLAGREPTLEMLFIYADVCLLY
jgi:hypothetical protein